MKLRLSIVLMTCLFAACSSTGISPTGDNSSSSMTSSSDTVSSASGSSEMNTMKTYTNAEQSYSIQYPEDFSVTANDQVSTDDVTVTGTSFVFPDSYSNGNTLDQAKVTVAMQPTCPQSIGTPGQSVTINGTTYQTADWNGVGAGNLYQGTTYETTHAHSCYLILLYMHSCNLGPDCSAGHTVSFNKKPLQDMFETMLHTLRWLD